MAAQADVELGQWDVESLRAGPQYAQHIRFGGIQNRLEQCFAFGLRHATRIADQYCRPRTALAQLLNQGRSLLERSGDDGQRWRQRQAGDIAIRQCSRQCATLRVYWHDRSGEATIHQIADNDGFAVAAATDQRNRVGFEQVIEISNGHEGYLTVGRWIFQATGEGIVGGGR